MLMRIVYDRQLQGIEPLYWCVGQEWNLMQEQECRCKARQPPPCPCCRPLTAVSFSSIFPYMLPCARRACAPLPPLSAGDILRACAPASILRSESIILLLRASDVNLRACTNLPKARIPSTITRWPERSGRRKCGRGQHDRQHRKHSHFPFFSQKLTKVKGGWEEDKKTASV